MGCEWCTARKPKQEAVFMKCTVNGRHDTCVPTISIHDPRFTTIEDINADGYICGSEVAVWLEGKYDDLWGAAVFPTCKSFSKTRAMSALTGLREQMSEMASDVADTVFHDCSPYFVGELTVAFNLAISIQEKGIIDYTIPAATDRGAGQLGLSWNARTGEIIALRQDSDGAKAGLKIGDKIISVDGFKYSDTIDYQMYQWYSAFTFLRVVPSLTYNTAQRLGVSANSLFFGPCGSTAKVEIERNGQSVTLEIPRGRG